MSEIWSCWYPTLELRRFDDTDKLTNPRLQQRWKRDRTEENWLVEEQFEWRDVPLVWEPAGAVERMAEAMRAKRRELIAQPLDRIWHELAKAALDQGCSGNRP